MSKQRLESFRDGVIAILITITVLELRTPHGTTWAAKVPPTDSDTLRATVTAFLDATSEVPDDGALKTHLVISDGARTSAPDALATAITATATHPTWLQIQAAINNARDQGK